VVEVEEVGVPTSVEVVEVEGKGIGLQCLFRRHAYDWMVLI
jgi:hypothetical protein